MKRCMPAVTGVTSMGYTSAVGAPLVETAATTAPYSPGVSVTLALITALLLQGASGLASETATL